MMYLPVFAVATLFLTAAACSSVAHSPASEPGTAASRCDRTPPPDAVSFTLVLRDSLVGRWKLEMHAVVPLEFPHTIQGRLELWRQDSARVWRDAFRRPLPESTQVAHPEWGRTVAGAFQLEPPDSSLWWRGADSRDPDAPGVEWYYGNLRIGDRDILDGHGEDLTVQWLAPSGFGGEWTSVTNEVVVYRGRALKTSAGYFCARRLGA